MAVVLRYFVFIPHYERSATSLTRSSSSQNVAIASLIGMDLRPAERIYGKPAVSTADTGVTVVWVRSVPRLGSFSHPYAFLALVEEFSRSLFVSVFARPRRLYLSRPRISVSQSSRSMRKDLQEREPLTTSDPSHACHLVKRTWLVFLSSA